MMDNDRQIALRWARKHYEQASDAEKGHWEFIFPELRESEDERIRRRMVEHFKSKTKETWCGIPVKDILKWLEKRKENPKSADSIPSDCVSDAKNENEHNESGDFVFELRQIISRHWYADEFSYRVDDEEGMASEIMSLCGKQKEQKPEHFELKAGKWYICHRAYCCRADHLTVKEGERFMCEKDGIVKGFVIKEPEKYFKECSAPAPMEDEQKPIEGDFPYNTPADTLEGEIENIWSKLSCENIFTATKIGFREVILHFVNYVRSKAATEWSEEDEKDIQEASDYLRDYANNCVQGGGNSKLYLQSLADRIESLRPQPKEEREPMEIKYGGKVYQVYAVRSLPGGATGYIIEDEPGHYDCIIHPDEVLGGGYGIKSNGSPYPTKEANFGQPRWKPSEEQMAVLEIACKYEGVFTQGQLSMLLDLKEQLKKL